MIDCITQKGKRHIWGLIQSLFYIGPTLLWQGNYPEVNPWLSLKNALILEQPQAGPTLSATLFSFVLTSSSQQLSLNDNSYKSHLKVFPWPLSLRILWAFTRQLRLAWDLRLRFAPHTYRSQQRSEEDISEQSCAWRDLRPDPLQEQWILLTTELSC